MTKMTEQKQTGKPHPFKGIINSNDDPLACAACSQRLDLGGQNDFVRVECCGNVDVPRM